MSAPGSLWCSPPDLLVLGRNEVHVWRAKLDLSEPSVLVLEQTLAADERTRAAQFHFSKDRTHFIVARGLLRTILGHYLNREPNTLRFSYNQYGKPILARESGNDALCFNVTHSYGMALYAITYNRDIGIDLEYIHTNITYEQIAEQFFSPYEVNMLRAVPIQIRQEAFFSCWTRKEAYLKARGLGLSLALSQFDVSVTPGAPAALLRTGEEDQDASCWSFHDLFPSSGYAAAVAVEAYRCSLKCWQWQEPYTGSDPQDCETPS